MPDELPAASPQTSSNVDDRQLAVLEKIEGHLAFFRSKVEGFDVEKVKSHPLARFLLK